MLGISNMGHIGYGAGPFASRLLPAVINNWHIIVPLAIYYREMRDTSALAGESPWPTINTPTNRRVKRERAEGYTQLERRGSFWKTLIQLKKKKGRKNKCVCVCLLFSVKLAGRKKWSNNVLRTRRHTSEKEIPLLLHNASFFFGWFSYKENTAVERTRRV